MNSVETIKHEFRNELRNELKDKTNLIRSEIGSIDARVIRAEENVFTLKRE